MHQTATCSTVGSIGDLGHIARALGAADPPFNIEAIGGGEARTVREDGRGVGIITILVSPDEDEDVQRLREVLEAVELDGGRKLAEIQVLPSLHVELRHDPGELGEAAAALGDAGINILSVLLVDAHGDWAVVSMAFDEGDIDAARQVFENSAGRFRLLPKHGGEARRNRVDGFVAGKVNRGEDDPATAH